jgi:hypothetical protein
MNRDMRYTAKQTLAQFVVKAVHHVDYKGQDTDPEH